MGDADGGREDLGNDRFFGGPEVIAPFDGGAFLLELGNGLIIGQPRKGLSDDRETLDVPFENLQVRTR
jgi:hypothetical protein